MSRNKRRWIAIALVTMIGVFGLASELWSEPLSLPPIHVEVGNGEAVEEG